MTLEKAFIEAYRDWVEVHPFDPQFLSKRDMLWSLYVFARDQWEVSLGNNKPQPKGRPTLFYNPEFN